MKLFLIAALVFLVAGSTPATMHRPATRGTRSEAHIKTQSYHEYQLLNKVASTFAERPARVDCEDLDDPWMGYVEDHIPVIHMSQMACNVLLDLQSAEKWEQAVSVLVLTHESYHVRHWAWWKNEGRVECQAIRHFRTSYRLLGGTQEQAEDDLVWALADHFHLEAKNHVYNYKDCKEIWWY